MANDFYTPGILSQAGGHAASLISDAGGAWGAAFQQLGQWTENEKAQANQIASSEKLAAMQEKATADRFSMQQKSENARFLAAEGLQSGEITLDQAGRLLGLQVAGGAVESMREAASQGIVATGALRHPIANINMTLGDAVSKIESLSEEIPLLYASGQTDAADAKMKERKALDDHPEVKAWSMMGTRSRDVRFEAPYLASFLRGRSEFDANVVKARLAGKPFTAAAIENLGATPDVASAQHALANGEKMSFIETKTALKAKEIAAKDGTSNAWGTASVYVHALDSVRSGLQVGMSEADKADPDKQFETFKLADDLVKPAHVVSRMTGTSLGNVMDSVDVAVKKLVPQGSSYEAKLAGQSAVARLLGSANPDTAKLLPGFLKNLPDQAGADELQDGFLGYASKVSPLELGARLKLQSSSGPISPKGKESELISSSFPGGKPLSSETSTQLDTMREFQAENVRWKTTARGLPLAPGGKPPTTFDVLFAKAKLEVLNSTYQQAATLADSSSSPLVAVAAALTPLLNAGAKGRGIDDKFDVASTLKILESQYDPTGRYAVAGAPGKILHNPYGTHEAAKADAEEALTFAQSDTGRSLLSQRGGEAGYAEYLKKLTAAVAAVNALPKDATTGRMLGVQTDAQKQYIVDKYGDETTPLYKDTVNTLASRKQSILEDVKRDMAPGWWSDPGHVTNGFFDKSGNLRSLTVKERAQAAVAFEGVTRWLGDAQLDEALKLASQAHLSRKALLQDLDRRLSASMVPANVDPDTFGMHVPESNLRSSDAVGTLAALAALDPRVLNPADRARQLSEFANAQKTSTSLQNSADSHVAQHPLLQVLKDETFIKKQSLDAMLTQYHTDMMAATDANERAKIKADFDMGMELAKYQSAEAMNRVKAMDMSIKNELEKARIKQIGAQTRKTESDTGAMPEADSKNPTAKNPTDSDMLRKE